MKKRIIAFVLVVVMAVMALVGCGTTAFNYASEDLTKYAKFEAETFAKELAAIEIEDFDFTTDETVRRQKVLEKIYNTLTDKVVAYGDNRVVNGLIGERDVVYYNYYATVVDDKNVTHTIFFDAMEEDRIDNNDYKSSHVIELGKITDDSSDFKKKLAAALSGKTLSGAYSTESNQGTPLKNLPNGTKLVISYTVNVIDDNKNKVEAESKTVTHEVVTVGSENALLTEVLKAEYNNTVGNVATFKDGAKTFSVKNGEKTYTYSSVKVEWKVTSDVEEFASFSVEYSDTDSSVVKDVNNKDVALKGLTVTYHIYPVSIVHVPVYDATSLLKYILGSSIKTDSLEIFEDESYKVGETKLSALIEELAKIYDGTTEKNTAVKDAKKAYDDAKAAVDKVGEKNATNEQLEELEKKTKELDTAKKTAVDAAIAEILTATSSADGAKPVAEAIVSEYDESIYHGLLETYNKSVIEAVAKEIYKAIDKSVEVTAYPESVIKEAYDRLYEAYEYSFYKEKHGTTAESEYTFHKGDFATFLKDHTGAKEIDGDIWKGIEAAITKEAQEKIAPVIKIYVVAKALEASAKVDLLDWAELDKTAGCFDVEVEPEDYETEEAYNEAVTKANESKEKAYENAKKEAERFLVTDDVFDQYKDQIGKAAFDKLIGDYGEANIRTALQFEKLMNYLTSVSTKREDGHNHPIYEERAGVSYIDFRYDGLVYTTVEPDADDGADE